MKTQRQSIVAYLLLITLIAGAVLSAGQTASRVQNPPSSNQPASNAAIQQNYGQLPLSFIPNAGQTDESVHFQVNSLGGTLFFTPQEVVLSLPQPPKTVNNTASEQKMALLTTDSAQPMPDRFEPTVTEPPLVVKMQLIGANPTADIAGADPLPGIVNYFIGNDPSQWHANIPTYAGITYRDVYPGIDLHYDGHQGTLKGTYAVAAGVDPSIIRWRYSGNTALSIDTQTGDLLIALANGNVLREVAPTAWQEKLEQRETVETRYALNGDEVRFEIGTYDLSLPLVIDPSFVYSTYLGGSGDDEGRGIALDSSGNVYVTGFTSSLNFPASNPFQGTLAGASDVFVTKLNAAGNTLIYSTYLGGSGNEQGWGITVDSSGNVYATGRTDSPNFPTLSSFQGSNAGDLDAFVTKLNSAGNALIYSTYLGGNQSDYGWSVTADSTGSAYVAGYTRSTNFPTQNPYQATFTGSFFWDAFVTKLNSMGNALVYSTYLGGIGDDSAYSISVDSSGNAYVGGVTGSSNFPTLNAYQPNKAGQFDAFVTKLNSAGNTLLYSTYFGGNGNEWGVHMVVDSSGSIYLSGHTTSTNLPILNPFQGSNAGDFDVFVTKLNAAGSALVYSTYLGGTGFDYQSGIVTDSSGNAYVVGQTLSTNFPTSNPIQGSNAGGYDAYVFKLNAAGNALVYSTYLGGSGTDSGWSLAVDTSSNAYVTGSTSSSISFPTYQPYQATNAGSFDTFVLKISDGSTPTPTPTSTSSAPNCSYIALRAAGVIDPFETNTFRLEFSNDNSQSAMLTAVSLRWNLSPMSPYMYPDRMVLGANQTDPPHWTLATSGLPARISGSLDVSTTSPGWSSAGGRTTVAGNAISTWRIQMANMVGTLSDNLTVYDFAGTDLTIQFPSAGLTCHITLSGLATATPRPSNTPTATTTGSPTSSSTPSATSTLTLTPSVTPSRTPTATSTVIVPHPDTIGIFRPSQVTFYLRNSNTTGYADSVLTFGASTYFPITGDWNGDGIDTPGVYQSSIGLFYLTNSTTNPATVSNTFTLGIAGDQPIVGDWDGDGKDGVGVFRPSNGLIYLKNSLTTGFADFTMVLGIPGDVGIAGDWNGDGKDSPGVYRPSNQVFYLTNSICNCAVFADAQLGLGIAGDKPFVGDWDADGKSGVGVYRQSNGLTYIKNALTTGFADSSFVFGSANDYPLAGYWVRVSTPSALEAAPTFHP